MNWEKLYFTLGVIHKVSTLRIRNFRHPSSPVRTHTFLTPLRHTDMIFKEDMTDIFCELLSIKEPKQRYKIKKLM